MGFFCCSTLSGHWKKNLVSSFYSTRWKCTLLASLRITFATRRALWRQLFISQGCVGTELPEYRLFYKVLISELFRIYEAVHQVFLSSSSRFFSLHPVFTSQTRALNIFFKGVQEGTTTRNRPVGTSEIPCGFSVRFVEIWDFLQMTPTAC